MEEFWRPIPEFTNYDISNLGRIYNNKTRSIMSSSVNNHGHVKITLTDHQGRRHTRSVGLLVAEAFVEPPNLLCNQIIVLDGDLTNLRADNLAWRPTWFAWRYTRQLKERQPLHFRNLTVENIETGDVYENIVEAGITEGLLFTHIWESTYKAKPCFPNGSVFEIIERV